MKLGQVQATCQYYNFSVSVCVCACACVCVCVRVCVCAVDECIACFVWDVYIGLTNLIPLCSRSSVLCSYVSTTLLACCKS